MTQSSPPGRRMPVRARHLYDPPKACPSHKRAYPSRHKAEIARRRVKGGRGRDQRIYRCLFNDCRQYHLTSQTKRAST